MDSPKVEVRETGQRGKGLFAIIDIEMGEIIADWTGGQIYHAKTAMELPNDKPLRIRDHAIQFEENSWIDTDGIGRYANHSCEPNCGIKGKFRLVTLREIEKGEELTFDYEMTEDSDWRLECKCGLKECRKTIGAFVNMPEKVRRKYKGHISDWLVQKYGIQ